MPREGGRLGAFSHANNWSGDHRSLWPHVRRCDCFGEALPMTRAWSFAAGLRQRLGFDAFIAAAIAATILAVYFQEPLTSRSVRFAPDGAGTSYDFYSYADGSSGGASAATADSRHPLSWSCSLRKTLDWPYCGMGLLLTGRTAARASISKAMTSLRSSSPTSARRDSFVSSSRSTAPAIA